MIESLLNERHKTHGNFREHAIVTQLLKRIMRNSPNWASLSMDDKEALEMIAHKIARILCGDPNHADHWVDISGYATLRVKR
jgi:hypothetical protein